MHVYTSIHLLGTNTLSYSHTLTLILSLSYSHSHSHTLTLILSYAYSHSHTLILSYSHTLTLSHSHTHRLRSLGDELDKPEPLVDCVVWYDGERWVASCTVDCDADGSNAASEGGYAADMSSVLPMAEFRVAYEYRRLTELDALNYSINIFDSGSILSLVVDSGAHGTHVAGIIAAHHPEQPECNGVAPGAQIVSLKIGDSRLGSMETGVGFTRALIEAVRRNCNVINMSFGEACTANNVGHFIKLAEEVVYKHNIVFVGSAGNNGPAISTVGAPCGTSSCILSVGAMVTSSLMAPGEFPCSRLCLSASMRLCFLHHFT
jgi:tripeptidyl-peptidase-2